MRKKFLRTDWMRFSKLGKNRKKLQRWKAPKGRDNKIRENRKGYPRPPGLGYRMPRKEVNRIDGKLPMRVFNVKDLEKIGKDNIIIIGKIGAKKKMEVIKKAGEMKLKIANLGAKK